MTVKEIMKKYDSVSQTIRNKLKYLNLETKEEKPKGRGRSTMLYKVTKQAEFIFKSKRLREKDIKSGHVVYDGDMNLLGMKHANINTVKKKGLYLTKEQIPKVLGTSYDVVNLRIRERGKETFRTEYLGLGDNILIRYLINKDNYELFLKKSPFSKLPEENPEIPVDSDGDKKGV